MKMRSWMLLGVGYLMGSKAGQERYEELRRKAADFVTSPHMAAALAQARENLGLAPSEDGASPDGVAAGSEVDVTDSDAEDAEESESEQPAEAVQ